MIGAAPASRVKVCRAPGCGKTSAEVHFPAMSMHRCCSCAAKQKTARAGRIQARGERVHIQRQPDPGSCPGHLAWVRSLGCTVAGRECRGEIQAHHVRSGTGGGTGLKPPDSAAVNLCAGHHGEGHHHGWRTFEAKYGVDLRARAEVLASLSPYLPTKQAA